MAAGILRVSPEKLQASAQGFETTGGTIKNLTDQMTSIVTSLSGQVWSGEAATAYTGKFNGLQDDMNRLYTMVKEYSEDLIAVAQQFSSAESKNVDAASSLSADVIV